MAWTNIQRVDADFPTAADTCNYTNSVIEPAMPHLHFCYAILTQLVVSCPMADFVNLTVVRKLLWLTQLLDGTERLLIATLLKKYYSARASDQPLFLRLLEASLVALRLGEMTVYAGSPLILLAGHCTLSTVGTHRAQILGLVMHGVIPLLTHPFLPLFAGAVRNFMAHDEVRQLPDVTVTFALTLQNTWPVVFAAKEVAYLELLLEVPLLVVADVFGRFAGSYFCCLGGLLGSSHSAVVLTVLSIYDRAAWLGVLRQHRALVFDALFLRVRDLAAAHWDERVREKATRVVVLMEMQSPPDAQRLTSGSRPRASDVRPGGAAGDISSNRWIFLINSAAEPPQRPALLRRQQSWT
jgi:hypothetical protein